MDKRDPEWKEWRDARMDKHRAEFRAGTISVDMFRAYMLLHSVPRNTWESEINLNYPRKK